jgi:hypothetical protein
VAESNEQPLEVRNSGIRIEISRSGRPRPLLVQSAEKGRRPFIHPILAPDSQGILTEDTPGHHPWQHGLYTGLNDVNGIGFWTEGLHPATQDRDGTFHPLPLTPAEIAGNRASWTVETEWRGPNGEPMLLETQRWTLTDEGEAYALDLDWSLAARTDLRFGQYPYGGLFLRMPYRRERGGRAVNSEGQANSEAESQRARWVAVEMPIEGRDNEAGIAMMDHPDNPDHPVPWRVDGDLGIAPSRCIAGEWTLSQGETARFLYRLFIFCGTLKRDAIESHWNSFRVTRSMARQK